MFEIRGAAATSRSKRPLAPPGRRPPPFSRAMRRSATFPRLPFHHLPNRAPRSLSPEWDDHNGFEIVITPPSSRGSVIVADVRKLPELPKPAEQNDAARISFERRHEVEVDQLWQDTVTLSELNSRDHSSYIELRNKLGIDKLSAMTLKGYNVRGHLDHDGPALCYPRYRSARGIDGRRPVGLKLIRLLGEKLEKKNYPNSEEDTNFQYYSGIFGWHMVRPSDKKVVVTTNERDAMAVYDATGELAVALPRGEKVDQQVLPYLEDFDKVVFWFPTYQQTHARNYAAYLAGSRCFIVTHRERPIEVARHGRLDDIKAILSSDQTKRVVRSTEQFRTTTDHRTGVRNEIVNHKRNLSGLAQWKRFPVLNKYLLGFRQGELTVLTGGTGVGKTTFVCEYAIDLMTQGVRYLFHLPDNRYFLPLQMRTLLCSFEMRDVKVLKWMVIQLAGKPLYRHENHPDVDRWLDRFERLEGGLFTMNTAEFEGHTPAEVAHAIREHVIDANIQHVVIDNLQFLVGSTNGARFDKFDPQDAFVRQIRRIATDTKAHVTLVVHPRKEPTNMPLTLENFGGSGRITQEADTVLVIQRRKNDDQTYSKYLHILKNRFGQRKVESDILEMRFRPEVYSHDIIERR